MLCVYKERMLCQQRTGVVHPKDVYRALAKKGYCVPARNGYTSAPCQGSLSYTFNKMSVKTKDILTSVNRDIIVRANGLRTYI